MKSLKLSVILLLFLAIILLIRSKAREREVTSYATQSLYVIIANNESISNSQIEKIIYEMKDKNMHDIGTAVILFRLLEKVDVKSLSNDSNYINLMSKKYKGKDMPFLDSL